MKKLLFPFLAVFILTTACSKKVNRNIGTNNLEIHCLGKNSDGTLNIRSWGTARKLKDAIEEAKKNALKEVIFTGVKNGSTSCGIVPLLLSVNAERNHESFFASFFSNSEVYNQFVTITQDNINNARKYTTTAHSAQGIVHSIDVSINKLGLKEYLKSKGIK